MLPSPDPPLSPAEEAELAALLESIYGGESFVDFVARIAPHEPVPAHGMVIADVLDQARRRPQRVCISWPPGHAKTTLLLRGVAWWLTRSPADTCAYVTYSDAQARSKSRMARDWAQQAGVALHPDFTGLGEWRTRQGGGLLAAGSRGKLTGQRVAGLLVVDDPYKSRDEVQSEIVREAIYTRFREVAMTRLQGGSVIVLHTRWSEDDLIGRLAREGWDVINLPAIAEANDALGRAPGEALWPDRYPVRRCEGPCGHDGHLEQIRADVGAYSWAALYTGKPAPPEGGLFQRRWWSWFRLPEDNAAARPAHSTDAPAVVLERDKQGRLKLDWITISVDSTFGKTGVTADNVGLLVVGGRGMQRFVLEDVTAQRTFEETKQTIRALLTRWPARKVLIEDAANGDAVASDLRAALGRGDIRDQQGLPVIAAVELLRPVGGKFARANAMVGAVEAGLWHLREGSTWADRMADEFAVFPNGAHDDRVDAASQLAAHYGGAASTLKLTL